MNGGRICKLALEDGVVFTGVGFGAEGTRCGEVVFNTAMTGYQEILTDPSYCGQIVTMTFPQIGNYGVNPQDFEADALHLSGFVVKEFAVRPSSHRATQDLSAFLKEHEIVGLAGIDTRALARRIRIHGALRGILSTEILGDLELVERVRASDSMVGANLVPRVTSNVSRSWSESLHAHRMPVPAGRRIVVLDCGIKFNILRHLAERGCEVTVVPATTPVAAILDMNPHGIVVGNGPGDPAAVTDVIGALRELVGRIPIFGICLGHQMLALALGAETYKLRFGHHGANVPVMDHTTHRVEITSQNHGFAVDARSLDSLGASVTHINLNDGSLEGFAHRDLRLMAVQFHPEASPGPHDSQHLFDRFVGMTGGTNDRASQGDENDASDWPREVLTQARQRGIL
jgi:carbamoyl-phosphate synthase small subunit